MGKKILVVDDEFFITRCICFLFEKEGYECQAAHDGEAALDQIRSEKPDLVFLDVDMPVKDGYEVAKEIRNRPEWKDIYIIMLTAKGQASDERRGLASGADEYVLKPFDPRAILRRVQAVIG